MTRLILATLMLIVNAASYAEDVPKQTFVRKYSNPHLWIRSFNFAASGKCSKTEDNAETNKANTYHCTWKQEGQTNKLIVTWLSEKYRKMAQIPPEGDVYYLILNGDSADSREYCLVRKPTEFDSQKLQNHDLMELSDGVPLCTGR